MKIVIASDSFKGSLGASKVAAAIARGVLEVCPKAVIDLCPMADGGGGTVDAMVAATGGRMFAADTFDPLGAPIRARFGMLGESRSAGLPGELGLSAAGESQEMDESDFVGGTAVIEMAAASGLTLIPPERRDPLRASTFGTGKLIQAAMDLGARKIIMGLGGSATVDGGCGCAQALGVTFVDDEGELMVCGLAGGHLSKIGKIDIADRDPRLALTQIQVACDVRNPLTGPEGAAAVYGPQKGATPEMVEQLDAGLRHLAHVVRKQLGVEIESLPGAGAAGGMGGGVVAFLGGKLETGVDIVAEAVGLKRRLSGAAFVITGEGRLDASSSFGKTAIGVTRIAESVGVRSVCIPGQAAEDAPRDKFIGVYPLVAGEITPTMAMLKTEELLAQRAAEATRDFLKNS